MLDTVSNQNKKKSFTRTIGNVTLHISDNKIINKEIVQGLKPIIVNKKLTGHLAYGQFSDQLFGTLDLETYLDEKGVAKRML